MLGEEFLLQDTGANVFQFFFKADLYCKLSYFHDLKEAKISVGKLTGYFRLSLNVYKVQKKKCTNSPCSCTTLGPSVSPSAGHLR